MQLSVLDENPERLSLILDYVARKIHSHIIITSAKHKVNIRFPRSSITCTTNCTLSQRQRKLLRIHSARTPFADHGTCAEKVDDAGNRVALKFVAWKN